MAPQSGATQQGIAQLQGFPDSYQNAIAQGAATQSAAGLANAGNNAAVAAGTGQISNAVPYYDYLRASAVAGDTGGVAGDLDDALRQQLTNPGSNQYIDELVARTLGQNTRNFTQQALPQIQNEAQIQGGFGGSRQGVAEGIALQGLADANALTASQLYNNALQADLNRQLHAIGLGQQDQQAANAQALQASALGTGLFQPGFNAGVQGQTSALALSPNVQQVGTFPARTLLESGSIQDQFQQALLNDEVARFNYGQTGPGSDIAALDRYAANVYGLPGLGGQSQTVPGESGGIAGALGGAATGAALASSIWNTPFAGTPYGFGLVALGALGGLFG